MAEPVSTAQLMARNNVNQLQQARKSIQDPVAGPVPINYGNASNPIGLISSGLSTIGQSVAAPGIRQAAQQNLDRQAGLQAEQTGYNRSQDVLAISRQDALNEQSQNNNTRDFDAGEANRAALLQAQKDARSQSQFNANRSFKAGQDAIAKAEGERFSAAEAGSLLNDTVGSFQNLVATNAEAVQNGDEGGLGFQGLTEKKASLIESIRKQNKADNNPFNDVDVDSLDNRLTAHLTKTFQLNPIHQQQYASFEEGQTRQLNQDKEDAALALKANTLPTDPKLSVITQLGTDGNLTSGVQYAIDNLPQYDNDQKIELKSSANSVIKAVMGKHPEYKKEPYYNAIIASALSEIAPEDGLLSDSDDFTNTTDLFGGDETSDLGKKIIDTFKLVQNSKKLLEVNSKAQKDYTEAIRAKEKSFTENLKKESDRLQLIQGIKVK